MKTFCNSSSENWYKSRVLNNPGVFPYLPIANSNLLTQIPNNNTKEEIKRSESESTAKCVNPSFSHVLIGHCLSALGDSIFLIADIGRAFRVMAHLGLQGPKVYIAGPRWSALNRGNEEYFSSTLELSKSLDENSWFRQKLYNVVGIDAEYWDFNSKWCNSVEISEIDGKIQVIETILSKIFKSNYQDFLSDNSNINEIEKILNKSRSLKKPLSEDEIVLDALVARHSKVLPMLIDLLRYFRSIDQKTLRYVYAQEIVQHKYINSKNSNKYIKVAPETEWRIFDEPFYGIDDGLSGIYFTHYRVKGKRVLPYNIAALDVRDMKNDTLNRFVPMLHRDLNLDHLKDAYKCVFFKMTLSPSIFLADLMCFFVYSKNNIYKEFKPILSSLLKYWDGCIESMEYHKNNFIEKPMEYAGRSRQEIESAKKISDLPFFMRPIWEPVNILETDDFISNLCKLHTALLDILT